ncbi:MAG: hypothetical protein GY874_17190 [Desulfobacteraceae bacterium]|nr:hypothetical protein [Desulfobacteraceae bacterium]
MSAYLIWQKLLSQNGKLKMGILCSGKQKNFFLDYSLCPKSRLIIESLDVEFVKDGIALTPPSVNEKLPGAAKFLIGYQYFPHWLKINLDTGKFNIGLPKITHQLDQKLLTSLLVEKSPTSQSSIIGTIKD